MQTNAALRQQLEQAQQRQEERALTAGTALFPATEADADVRQNHEGGEHANPSTPLYNAPIPQLMNCYGPTNTGHERLYHSSEPWLVEDDAFLLTTAVSEVLDMDSHLDGLDFEAGAGELPHCLPE